MKQKDYEIKCCKNVESQKLNQKMFVILCTVIER